MDYQDDWSSLLTEHPIFSSKADGGAQSTAGLYTELSKVTLPTFHGSNLKDAPSPPGRRQTMSIKDTELIVAVGSEIRVTSLKEAQTVKEMRKTYKVLNTPDITFDIHQIVLNATGKLLCAVGTHRLVVVVLPRPGYMRLQPQSIDCKSVQVGKPYHNDYTSSRIVKVQWHPWGEAGSTLLVMTVDGKLREYDISSSIEEPTQVVSFGLENRKQNAFHAYDPTEFEVASFTLGAGSADWGPLTIYALMKSGDIYSVCPYLPLNASVPSSYLHALECFISAKQEYLAKQTSQEAQALSVTYDYQRKYINALLKQLPCGTVFPASSRIVNVHPPTIVKHKPLRQGPFLLQPSPVVLPGSEECDATDIAYLSFGSDVDQNEDGKAECLGILLITSKDGRVDVCLDVDKVDARWESQKNDVELPMLAVFETVDLGLVSLLSTERPHLDLINANHPVIYPDPIHDDTVFVYHAFGVHRLNLEKLQSRLREALHVDAENQSVLQDGLSNHSLIDIRTIALTFSAQQSASNPINAVAIPNDVYLSYSISILTSSLRISSFPLNVRLDGLSASKETLKDTDKSRFLTPLPGPSSYATLLGTKFYEVPQALSELPSQWLISEPLGRKQELRVTPETLRHLNQVVERFSQKIREVIVAYKDVVTRSELQQQEYERQAGKLDDIRSILASLKVAKQTSTEKRVKALRDGQGVLLGQLHAILQAMMKHANPELSDQEKRWFEELKRMEEQVLGLGNRYSQSLRTRVALLKQDYDRLRPELELLQIKQLALATTSQSSAENLGISQAFELGQHSHKERTKLQKIRNELMGIAKELDYPLSSPPPLQESLTDRSIG